MRYNKEMAEEAEREAEPKLSRATRYLSNTSLTWMFDLHIYPLRTPQSQKCLVFKWTDGKLHHATQ